MGEVGMNYKYEEARKIVMKCAKEYRDKLLDKRFLVIYRNRSNNCIQSIQVKFYKRNFQHLTGLDIADRDNNILSHCSVYFFNKCINNKLSADEIRFKPDGTTPLKLIALPALMDMTKITKITGDYNNSRPFLMADKVMGGVNFCLGLRKTENEYVPTSALLENIKTLTDAPSQVLIILEKEGDKFSKIRHTAKGLNYLSLTLPPEITSITDFR